MCNWIPLHFPFPLPIYSICSTTYYQFVLTICHYSTGDIVSLFAGVNYSTKHALVDYRVKQLALTCIWAIYQNRFVSGTPVWINLLNFKLYWIWVLVGCNISPLIMLVLNSEYMRGIVSWFCFHVKSYPCHDFDYYSFRHSIMQTLTKVLSCLNFLLIKDWIV